MRRTFAAIALVVVLLVGASVVAGAAYQIGLTTAINTAVTESGATVVTPVVPGPGYAYGYPGYGWGHGWGFGGPGFGFFGLLGAILFLFLLIGLVRAVFFRGGRGWGPNGHGDHRGWGGPGWGGPGGWDRGRSGAPRQVEEWHRQLHETDTAGGASSTPPPDTDRPA